METLIPTFLRRQRNQRHLTLENLSAKVGMSSQHLCFCWGTLPCSRATTMPLALDRPVQNKPRLKKLLREPGVLG